MAIGKRIKFFRIRKNMTQKQFGEKLGFLGRTSDVRIAQYESEARTPRNDLLQEMANVLGVSTRALNVPDIDSYVGLAHTLFALEDMYGIKITKIDGELCLHLDKSRGSTYLAMMDIFLSWYEYASSLQSGEISKWEYDQLRYNYPNTSGEPSVIHTS